jgi:hypothetical protein
LREATVPGHCGAYDGIGHRRRQVSQARQVSQQERRPSAQPVPPRAAVTQDRDDMVVGAFQCRPGRHTTSPGLIGAIPRPDDTRLAVIRPPSRLAVTHARSGTFMRLFLGNSTASPRSGATSPDSPTATVPRRSEQLLLNNTLSEPPGQRQRRCHPQARQAPPAAFQPAIPDAVTTVTGIAAAGLDLPRLRRGRAAAPSVSARRSPRHANQDSRPPPHRLRAQFRHGSRNPAR